MLLRRDHFHTSLRCPCILFASNRFVESIIQTEGIQIDIQQACSPKLHLIKCLICFHIKTQFASVVSYQSHSYRVIFCRQSGKHFFTIFIQSDKEKLQDIGTQQLIICLHHKSHAGLSSLRSNVLRRMYTSQTAKLNQAQYIGSFCIISIITINQILAVVYLIEQRNTSLRSTGFNHCILYLISRSINHHRITTRLSFFFVTMNHRIRP